MSYGTAIPSGPLDRYPSVSWIAYLRGRPAAATFSLLSFGAAGIHFAVSPDHFGDWAPYGVAFGLLAWFQVLWGAAYLARPSYAWGRVAALINAGVVVVWVWSRTLGLPIGPQPGSTEAVGFADALSSLFEILLVVGLLAQEGAIGRTLRRQRARWAAVAIAVTLVVVSASLVALVALAPPSVAMG